MNLIILAPLSLFFDLKLIKACKPGSVIPKKRERLSFIYAQGHPYALATYPSRIPSTSSGFPTSGRYQDRSQCGVYLVFQPVRFTLLPLLLAAR